MNDRLIPITIIETLQRSGALEFDSLYKAVSKFHGELDERLFEDYIMELEIRGLIRVYNMARGKRRVELVK